MSPALNPCQEEYPFPAIQKRIFSFPDGDAPKVINRPRNNPDAVVAEAAKRRADWQREEERLARKREDLDQKLERVDQRDRKSNQRATQLDKLAADLEKKNAQIVTELERVAGLSLASKRISHLV